MWSTRQDVSERGGGASISLPLSVPLPHPDIYFDFGINAHGKLQEALLLLRNYPDTRNGPPLKKMHCKL